MKSHEQWLLKADSDYQSVWKLPLADGWVKTDF